MMKTNVCVQCGSSFVQDDNEDPCAYCESERKHRLKKFTDIIDDKTNERRSLNKMATIKDTAANYTPKTVKNISELKTVSVGLEIKNIVEKDLEGKEYSYNYVEVNNEKYRVPATVLSNLKAILQVKPNLMNFAVTKQGEGKNTKYQVIPLD